MKPCHSRQIRHFRFPLNSLLLCVFFSTSQDLLSSHFSHTVTVNRKVPLTAISYRDNVRVIPGLDPESTLVVVVSKTMTTAETMLNARTVRDWMLTSIKGAEPADVTRQHFIACRSETV